MRSARRVVLVLAAAAATSAACGTPAPARLVTFNKDVAPIVFANCAPCHRPRGAAPFSLLTYSDAAGQAREMAMQTRMRHMPPWQPEPGDFPFEGARRLTQGQIDVIQRWVDGGTVEGDPADRPAAPVFADGWQLGRPDAVLRVPKPFVVQPGPDDVYRNLVFRTTLSSDVFVRAVEFDTGGAPIHHAVIRVDHTPASRRRDGADGQPGFDGMAFHSVHDPDGQFVGWAPGRGPITSPPGMPWRLPKGADLVVEMHVIPVARPAALQPEVALFLTSTPPARTPITVRMGSKRIDIPPGTSGYIVSDVYDLPVPIELLSVYPHAHYLGAEMRVTATLPGGAERTLLHIRDWSFHWQQDYRYLTPIPLPRGTRLTMRYTYDNSAANPDNPSEPPVRVRAGPESTDEMAELGLQLLAASAGDAAVIARAFAERDLRANLELAETRVREEPGVADYREVLGGLYVETDRHVEAIPHLEAAIRLDPRLAGAHNYLGVARLRQSRPADALAAFRRAEQLDRRDERLPFNVGNVLAMLSRGAEAAAAFERALAINPDFLDARVNLAVLQSRRGLASEAIAHYARALELDPGSAMIHSNMGGALAAAGRYREALTHTRRALALEPGYAPALDNLRRLERMGVKD